MKLVWYFDFISPFAYLQLKQFDQLPKHVEIEYKPVLLAGLLEHWQNVGPAEVAPKRVFTYQFCQWKANALGIEFNMPPAHPFNSLLPLRLSIATNNQVDKILSTFEVIWRNGIDINSPSGIQALEKIFEIQNLQVLTQVSAVKEKLRLNTEQAAQAGVFGVPTFVADCEHGKQLFWGLDAMPMLLDYLSDPEKFADPKMTKLANLPTAAERTRRN